MSNDVTTTEEESQLPAFLQNQGNANRSDMGNEDLIIPRIKLLQGTSPELETYDEAKSGQFWHTVGNVSLGNEIVFTPLFQKRKFVLFDPNRGSDTPVLDRSDDGINWAEKKRFEVKIKGIKEPQIWDTTEGTVNGSGLDKFGSSVEGDEDSVPAATLVYEYAIMIEGQDFPCILSLSKSAVKKGKILNSSIAMSNTPMTGMKFKMGVVKEKNSDGEEYWNYSFAQAGYVQDQSAWERNEKFAEELYGASYKTDESDLNDDAKNNAESSGEVRNDLT